MFNLNEETKECTLAMHNATRRFFLAGQERREFYVFIFDVGICGIYLSLTIGTVEFKQLD